ncbi:MAG: hypothetical protein E7319_03935 [Clostridiales bacterium]|nr:hypothetical protein [Clostridiales bacterium]
MHYNFRKMLSVLLSILLVMSVCLPSFAEEVTSQEQPEVIVAENVVIEVTAEENVTDEIDVTAGSEELEETEVTEEEITEETEVTEEEITEETEVTEEITEETEVTEEEITEETEATEEEITEEAEVVEETEVTEETEVIEEEITEETEVEEVPAYINCGVTIEIVNEKSSYQIGDTITLKATVTGCEGLNYQVNWEYNDNIIDENNEYEWKVASTGMTYTYTITENNADWQWRAAVVISE